MSRLNRRERSPAGLPRSRRGDFVLAIVFGVSFLEYLMAQADKILIGFYLNAREAGIYAVAMAWSRLPR